MSDKLNIQDKSGLYYLINRLGDLTKNIKTRGLKNRRLGEQQAVKSVEQDVTWRTKEDLAEGDQLRTAGVNQIKITHLPGSQLFNYSFYTTTNKLLDKRKKLHTGNVNTFALLKKKPLLNEQTPTFIGQQKCQIITNNCTIQNNTYQKTPLTNWLTILDFNSNKILLFGSGIMLTLDNGIKV